MNTYLIVKTLGQTAAVRLPRSRSSRIGLSKPIGGLRPPPSFSNPYPAYGCCMNAATLLPLCWNKIGYG